MAATMADAGMQFVVFGKSSASWAFVSALLKSCPGSSVLYVCPDIPQADDTYRELVKLIPEEDVAVWTSGHDAIMSEAERLHRARGYEANAPLFTKMDLQTRRVAIITHKWYIQTGGVHGALKYRAPGKVTETQKEKASWCQGEVSPEPRTIHIIDERLKEVDQTDIGHADIVAARDTITARLGTDAPLAVALRTLEQFARDAWDTERQREGVLYRPLDGSDALEWFRSGEAEIEQRRSVDGEVRDSIAFGRYLSIGHAFLARWQNAKRGGRFVSYKLDLPRIPGSVLLDASADIDGVEAMSPSWRRTVAPPKATFGNLSIKHVPLPLVDKNGVKLSIKEVTDRAENSIPYAEWIKATIIAETEPGECVLAVTHKAMIEQRRLPDARSFDHPDILEGGRRVAYVTYGRGIGSNSFKRATTVFLFGLYYRPVRVAMGEVLGFKETRAGEANLGELGNHNTRHALMTAIKNGHMLRWAKQLAMRGSARNFDDNGVCGRMKLVVAGDLDLWLSQHSLLFPGASFTVSEETKATAVTKVQAAVAFAIEHPQGFTSKELVEATGFNPAHIIKLRKVPAFDTAVEQAGLEFVPGGGRGKVAQWLPRVAIAAE
jgi:hypothetical protein